MDVRNWKRVLQLWISEFDYTDKSFSNLEQSEVEEFFEHVRQHHEQVLDLTLTAFLKEHYSAFQPNLDDQNELSSADYAYVYSLLLHFTCVKYPTAYFQEKCRKLSNAAQEAVALFFKLMLACPKENKENLRHIIGEVAISIQQKLSPQHMSDSSGTPSPAKTPLSKSFARVSPSTPKTVLLDERTRELHSLKAELENERYEKSLLEAQIKENESKIKKLSQDCKRLQEKVIDMKNDMFSSDAEDSSSPVQQFKESNQQQRRFMKEINEKEKEISQLTDNIGRLFAEKTTLKEKLTQAEDHVKLCMTRIQEADCKVFELTAELEKKNANIKYLNEHKNELERYIGELRTSSGNARPDFNNSSDCLDSSFSRANSSMSPSSMSPENLACSVVDIKLQEKTNEVSQLRSELKDLRCKNTKLIEHIVECAQAHAHNFNITMHNMLMQPPSELADPLEYFLVFSEGLKELNKLYMNDLENMRVLQENSRILCEKNALLNEQLEQVNSQLEANKDRVDMLENVHSELLAERQTLEDKLTICASEIEHLNSCKSMLEEELKTLAHDFSLEQRNSNEHINEINQKLAQERDANTQLEQELTNLRIKLQESQEKLVMRGKEHQNETDALNERLTMLQRENDMQRATESLLKEKHEKLIIQSECLKKSARDADLHLENMRSCLHDKEVEMQKLGDEINALRQHNVELEQRLNDLSGNYKQKQQKHQQNCDKFQQDLSHKNEIIVKQSEQLNLISAKLEAYNTLLIAPLLTKKEQSLTLQEAVCRLRMLLADKLQMEQKELLCQQQCFELQQQLETLEKQSLQEVEQHKEAMEAAMQQVEQLQVDQERLLQLEQELKVVIEKHNEAQIKLQEADQMLTCALEEQSDLKMQLQQIQDDYADLSYKLEAEKVRHEECQRQIEDLEAELEEKDLLQNQLQLQLTEKQQFIDKLMLDLAEKQPLQEKLQQELTEKRQMQMQLQEELVQKQQELERLQSEESDNLFHLEKLQQERSIQLQHQDELQRRWQSDVTHWQHMVDKYKCQYEILQTEKVSVVHALEQSLEHTKMNLDDKLSRYEHVVQQHEQLQQDHRRLQLSHKQLEQQFQEKQQELINAQHLQELNQQQELEHERVLEELRMDIEKQKSLMDRNDAALLNILATLENAANLAAECEAAEDNLFNISQMENSHVHLQQLKRSLNRLLHKISQLQKDVATKEQQKQDLENTLEKTKTQYEIDSNERTKELREQLSNSAQDLKQMEQQLAASKQYSTDLEKLLKQLEQRLQQQITDYKQLEERMQQQLAENKQLNEHLDTQKELKQHLEQQVHELVQKNLSMEKKQQSLTEVLDECLCMKQKAEIKCEELEMREKKLTSECDKSQTQLSVANEKMQFLEQQQKSSEERLLKLQNENSKLKETQEAQTKRIEKLALKLGDAQARGNKLERELNKTLETHQTGLDAIQREKDQLQNETKALRERLSRSERVQEQLAERISSLEATNNKLMQTQRLLQNMETELKNKTNKLEKQRETSEEKLRELESNLNSSENEIVRLRLEVGALNSELEKYLIELKQNEQLQKEQQQQQEALQEQLQKSQLAADVQQQEIDQLRQQLLVLRAEKCSLEDEQAQIKLKLQEAEQKNLQLSEKRNEQLAMQKQLQEQFEQKMAKCQQLERALSEQSEICSELEQQLTAQRKKFLEMQQQFKEHAKMDMNYEQLYLRLTTCQQLLEKEQEINSQLRTDNQILQAKYAEAKQRLQDEHKLSEERIKENRLELEGKLEKMKNKMKNLYSEEIAKMKTKQERESVAYKTQIDELKAQNAKYEDHTSKLSAQIMRLNDNMLENQRQHAVMATKLKKLQEPEDMRFKRPSNMHLHASAATINVSAPRNNMGSNLAMEDEEGEVFNNTYLADLKAGRMSDMNKNIGPEELQYRNSMLPPHLQSSYAAQYDHGLAEEELKDAQHMLDDSMSGLLTGGGVRKKISGATHYKRPGPPTPSKNGGRLSLGGCSEPPREILKEYNVSSSKTPSRFGFLGSRFSMGKDEKSIEENLCKAVRIRNLQKQQKAAKTKYNTVCTSTPRKSKSHYDQRRQLEQMLKTATPKIDVADIKVEANSFVETPVSTLEEVIAPPKTAKKLTAAQRRRCHKRRISRRWRADTSSLSSSTDMKTPADAAASNELQTNRRYRGKRKRNARISMHLCGNMFSNMRTPTRMLLRDFNRTKAQKQRMERFNKMRQIVSSDSKTTTPNSNHITPVEKNELETRLVTTQDLIAFDKKLNLAGKATMWPDAADLDNGNSLQFEQLLQATTSQAPFEVQRIKFNVPSEQNSSNSTLSTISNICTHSRSTEEQITLSTARALTATTAGTSNLSRTIYGGSVIFNRRIPHVSSTLVRKSSIYVKNNNATTMHENDIILVTDQTITIADLARMWRQMNTTARITICFATLASISTIIVLINRIFHAR